MAVDPSLRIALTHYENFPVAMPWLQIDQKKALQAVYTFARTADDLADEGPMLPTERLQHLQQFEFAFKNALHNKPNTPFWDALVTAVTRFALPVSAFEQLLWAFRYDSDFKPFKNFSHLIYYCEHSANPIGHLVLKIYGLNNIELIEASDFLCTALQILNFLQDIHDDCAQNRLTIPEEDLATIGLSYNEAISNPDLLAPLMPILLARVKGMLIEASRAPRMGSWSFKIQWWLTLKSGWRVWHKLQKRKDLKDKARLNKWDWIKIFLGRNHYGC